MAEENNRSVEFWSDKWHSGNIKWNMDQVNPYLIKHAPLLLPRPEKHRILVPLCGKSLDLLWLYTQGHRVVGVEAVEKAVVDFSEENKLEMKKTTFEGGCLYQTKDHRLVIYVCDFFKALPHKIGRFDAVWDRGSLVAINTEDRVKYSELICQMLLPHFRYLLSTFTYTPNDKFAGPPSNLPTYIVHKLFGDAAVETLESVDRTESKLFENMELGQVMENFLLLTPSTPPTEPQPAAAADQ